MDLSKYGDIFVCFLVLSLAKEWALFLGESSQSNLLKQPVYSSTGLARWIEGRPLD